jgi:dTDP-4-amino-4,6-dideoxygalactose transaminase
METLGEIAQKHNLMIIEDAAQALGAKFYDKSAGSFGLTGCFSFYPAKILGCFGDGGALVTNSQEIAEKTRLLRDHGQKTPHRSKLGTGQAKTELVCYGWNSRLDNIQAAILNLKLKYLPEWTQRRREIANLYFNGLSNISEIKLPPQSDERNFDIYQNYVLRVSRRDELAAYLKERGVETLIKDPIALHHQSLLGLSSFKLPYTEQLAQEVISLPIYPEIANEQVEYVIDSVKKFYV